MGEQKTVMALIVGGEANAGPPLGPALGPLGVNVMAVVKKINEATSSYKGMRVPVKITVDTETKSFEVEVGTPTTSALLVKEAGIEKGASNPKANFVGNLTREQVVSIAKVKMGDSYASKLKSAVKEVLGSCVSMGIKVGNKDPREVLKEVDSGGWDD
ncbi:MAG: 50S ribosomal protein L11, partial [Nitrososphaerales archaeon]